MQINYLEAIFRFYTADYIFFCVNGNTDYITTEPP